MVRRNIHKLILLGATILIFAVSFIGLFASAYAAPFQQDISPTPTPSPVIRTGLLSKSDEYCLECHGNPGLTLQLEDGEKLELFNSPEQYANSIHGQLGYACVQCHTTVGDYPHPAFSAVDLRDVSLKLYEACERCHFSQYSLTLDSVHADAITAGDREAAICTDCHTAHAIQRLTDPNTREILPDAHAWVPETCAQCHYAIYQKYITSVHGSALVGEGNHDVPTCIDCHGVHNIQDPTTAAFLLKSPQMCADCHSDSERMGRYGISTDVLETYVADFHGTTVVLFERESPDAETNKPVCFDCHGIHDIKRTDDAGKGLQIRENLLVRCQVCHPEATINFPAAWLSHYIPSPDKNPAVYYVNLFYKIMIPTVLGGMAILIVLDFNKLVRNRRSKTKSKLMHQLQPDVPAPPKPPQFYTPVEKDVTEEPLQPPKSSLFDDTEETESNG